MHFQTVWSCYKDFVRSNKKQNEIGISPFVGSYRYQFNSVIDNFLYIIHSNLRRTVWKYTYKPDTEQNFIFAFIEQKDGFSLTLLPRELSNKICGCEVGQT